MRYLLIVIALMGITVGCGDDSGGATTTLEEQRQRMAEEDAAEAAAEDAAEKEAAEKKAAEKEGDAAAQLACDHFRNVAGDASQGILTEAELREKLAEVDDDAQISEVDGVRNAARAMLRAVTQGDSEALSDAVEEMDAACDSIGH